MLIFNLELVPVSRDIHFSGESLCALTDGFIDLQLDIINKDTQVTLLQFLYI